MDLVAGKTRVMRNDGQYDTVRTITSQTPATKATPTSPALPAKAVVHLELADRSAEVVLNENDVWQEPWAE